MKFLTTLVIAAAATVSGYVTTECPSDVASKAYVSLISLLSGGDLDKCASESGYNMLTTQSLPTDEQLKKMCGLASCKSLLNSVVSKNPPDCVLTIPTSGFKMNIYGLVTSFPSDCARVSGTTAPTTAPTAAPPSETPSSTSPQPTVAPPAGTPSVVPNPTKPAC